MTFINYGDLPAMEQQTILDLIRTENSLPHLSKKELLRGHIVLMDQEINGVYGLERISWYQGEIRHLSVPPESRRQGYAKAMIQDAIDRIKNANLKLATATIRVDNPASEALFSSMGFSKAALFYGKSGTQVGYWVKSL